jgi:hypothetical protein
MHGGEWKSTDEAPRDGTRILGWFGDRCIVVFWRRGPRYVNRRPTGETVSYWSDGYSRFREPDAWQPEPSPPDAVLFPAKAPPPAPRGNTTVVKSPAARRRIVEHTPKREIIRERPASRIYEMPTEWCGQCERRVTAAEAKFCPSIFCKAKERA